MDGFPWFLARDFLAGLRDHEECIESGNDFIGLVVVDE